MEKKQSNNSLTFDCFCVVLLDLLSNVDNVRCVYEMKHLEERFAILFYGLLPERTVDLKELWEITVLKKKSAKASEVLACLKSFVDGFAENPLKIGNPMKAVTYYVAYALLCFYFNTIIDDEVEDFGVEQIEKGARKKLNHKILIDQLMNHFEVNDMKKMFELYRYEAGVDIADVTYGDFLDYCNTGVPNGELVWSMGEMMCYPDWYLPMENTDKKIFIFLLAYLAVLHDNLDDLYGKEDYVSLVEKATTYVLYYYPEFFISMENYGYKIWRFLV